MENPFWAQSISEVCSHVKSEVTQGLSESEANQRLKEFGPNALPKKRGAVWWKLLLSQFSSLLVWLLIAAALVAGILGEALDSWAILAIVLFNGALGFFQEYRAEKSIEALQKLANPTAKVIREGVLKQIPTEQVVYGDLVLLEAGDRIPADGRLVEAIHIGINESSLTGESVPVSKMVGPLAQGCVLADRKNMVFLGTTVVKGKGKALITATGSKTEMGAIASQLIEQKKEKTPLQKQLNKLGKKLVYICLAVVVVVFALGVFKGLGLVNMLLISLSLAVAAIPEGLPAAVTIALSIGVHRMAEKKALVRRLSSVETLGSTSVICTDKTGTLTQNAMTVRQIWVDRQIVQVGGTGYTPEGAFDPVPKDLHFALKIGALCNNANILKTNGEWTLVGDPTEAALLTVAAKGGFWKNTLEEDYRFIDEHPFDSDRKMMSVLRQSGQGELLFVKGAPDEILARSHKWLQEGKEVALTEGDKKEIAQANQQMASQAYRVLAVAYQNNLNAKPEEDLIFVGLLAMIDPPRAEVKEAIQKCREAGIRPVMVTGDHKITALAIARELNLDTDKAVDGVDLEGLSDDEIQNIGVFSRISASHKLRIIQALQKKGQITAMTGDGVNDAPALMAADIGVAMGITGTDVTKESSDMILLDDNFASIVRAIEQGRGIYDNIVKFVSYLLSSNIAEILVIFIVMLMGSLGADGRPFPALLPIQLLWINLVTDGFPAITLALDPVDPSAMQRPPKPSSEEILNRRFSLFVCALSVLVTIGALTACYWGLRTSVAMAQTMTFTTLIVLELVRVQMIRTQYRLKLFSNLYLIGALASSFLMQLVVLYVPALRPIFGTVALGWVEWSVIGGVAFALWWAGLAVTKFFYSRLGRVVNS